MATLDLPAVKREQKEASEGGWELKKLKPWHRQLCSLVAQGMKRQEIATILDCTPEYISMLAAQPLIQEEIHRMSGFAALQLEAQFTKSVEVIGDVLENGKDDDRLKAARLQMEATKRIGAHTVDRAEGNNMEERLVQLAERLLYLQGGNARIINEQTGGEKE